MLVAGDPPIIAEADDGTGVLNKPLAFPLVASSSSKASFANVKTRRNPSRSLISPVPLVPFRQTLDKIASGRPDGRKNSTAFCPLTDWFPARRFERSASNNSEEERV